MRIFKKDYNVLVITIALIVGLGSALFYFTFIRGSKEAVAWFDDTWHYRAPVTITNSVAGNLENFQVAVTIDTAALITAGKMQSTCADLRVTSLMGKSLPYWIEPGPGCNSATTKVWVKVDVLPKDGSTIYMYYGNPGAPDNQKGESVFEFFDDFSGTAVDQAKWITGTLAATTGPEWSISGGSLRGGTTNRYIQTKTAFTGNYAAEARVYESTSAPNGFSVIGFYASASDSIGPLSHSGTLYYRDDGDWPAFTFAALNQWSKYMASATGTSAAVSAIGETSGSGSAWFVNSGISGERVRLGARYDDSPRDQTFVAQWDYVFVRKVATTAPTVGSAGTEEKGTAPVGWWKFDEGSGNTVVDSSGNGNTGTIVSTATWKNEDSCKSGKCMSFDGTNGYVNAVHNNTTLDITDRVTLSTWVKFNALTGAYEEMIVKSGGYYWIGAQQVGSNYFPYFLIYSGTTNRTVTGKTILATGVWYHVVGAWDKDEGVMRLYVNGKLENSLSGITTAIMSTTADVLLGGDNTLRLNGLLDDARVYNYALTAAQIKQLYASGATGKTSSNAGAGVSAGARPQENSDGLVGWWKMDESSWAGAANEVVDSSGAGNHGTSCASVNTSSTARYGRAGEFDGSTTCVVLSNSPIADSTNFTNGSVFTWVKTGDNSGNIQGIAVKRYAYGMFLYSGKLQLYDWTTSLFIDSGVNIADNNWHYIGFTFQDGVINGTKIYVDGTPRLTTRYSIVNQSVPFAIGAGTNSAIQAFNGLADDVKLWNRVRTAEQIMRDYETGPPPVMHLKMDEGSGTQVNDDSGNGNKGSLVGGATWTNGKYGKALSFDGSTSYIRVTAAPNLNVSSAFTIGGWMYLKSYGEGRTLISKRTGSNEQWALRVYSNSITLQWYDGSWLGANVAPLPSTMSLNSWHHYIVTYDGSVIKIYFDGISYTPTGSAPSFQSYADSDVCIGQDCASGRFADGRIDDVRVYNYARTPKQVIEDMNAGHPAGGSPVGSYAAYWKFDEGNNAYAYDAGPNANTCSFVGGASSTPLGKFGSAVKFLSTGDYLDCGTGSSLNIAGNQITLSTWIKSSSPSSNQGILIKGPLASSQGEYSMMLYENKVYLRLNGAVGTAGEIISKTLLAADTWYHIVATYDGANQYLYINGVLDNKKAFTDNINDSASDSLKIGVYYTTDYPFLGTIDEVKVYPYVLSPAEIKTEYNRGAVMMLGVAPTSTATSGMDPGGAPPVGWWKMDEGSGTLVMDATGNGNNGTLSGTTIPTWKSAGYCKKGGCLSFDGSSGKITTGSYTGFGSTNSHTYSAWINIKSFAGPFLTVIDRSPSSGGGGTSLAIYQQKISFLYNGSSLWSQGNSTLSQNKWYFIALAYDSSTNKVGFYLNGAPDGTPGALGSFDPGTSPSSYIGVYQGNSGYFNGTLDDVKIYNYARTPAQIAYDYNKGAPIAWWKFDEGQGYQAKDASGNGNNGALTGFPTDNSEWVTGKWNKGLTFDGSTDYVLMGSSAGSNASTQDHTYSAWVYRTKQDCLYCWITNNGDNANGSSLVVNGNKIGYFYNGGNAVTYGKTDVAANAWHHIAVVYSSTTNKATFYLDSKSDGVSSALGAWSASSGPVVIGRWGGNDQHYFGGRIDDVRIYNYALSVEQIKQVYNNGAAAYFK